MSWKCKIFAEGNVANVEVLPVPMLPMANVFGVFGVFRGLFGGGRVWGPSPPIDAVRGQNVHGFRNFFSGAVREVLPMW